MGIQEKKAPVLTGAGAQVYVPRSPNSGIELNIAKGSFFKFLDDTPIPQENHLMNLCFRDKELDWAHTMLVLGVCVFVCVCVQQKDTKENEKKNVFCVFKKHFLLIFRLVNVRIRIVQKLESDVLFIVSFKVHISKGIEFLISYSVIPSEALFL